MERLKKYGASQRFFAEAGIYPDLSLARVVAQHKDLYKIVTEAGEISAEISGKFRHEATCLADYPVVGDFVMVLYDESQDGNAIIRRVLTRKSAFERSAVGLAGQVQVVAANIDIVFICMSMNQDFNLSRLERYLSVAWDSRAKPVVVLTKSDLCENLEAVLAEVSSVAIGVDVVMVSRRDEESHACIRNYMKEGVTASFIGSSGVGKSTLINCLLGEDLLSTSGLRNDDKGRHTTTGRQIFLLPDGGVVMDTPGMRELGVESVNLSKSFSDIDELAARCRFSDCSHRSEPGCAVRVAIDSGDLDERRLENYQKLKKEARYEGLSSRQIETEKLNSMFEEVGGMKKARDFIKEKVKKR